MANPEHLKILKQGVEVWNQWWEENPDINPDLSSAYLRGANLERANLRYVRLRYVDLREADLCEANLCEADFYSAKLRSTDLRRANLRRANLYVSNLHAANLSGAELSDANLYATELSGADLSEANLAGLDLNYANLCEANLSEVNLGGTNIRATKLSGVVLTHARCIDATFADVDLSETKGLEKIYHSGPSTIGIDTLYKSKGNIPEVFLRGCGVPDQMIEYARSLTANPIEYYSCFISFSSKDEEFARRVHNDLQAKGVRCWYAPHDMKIGDKIRPTIDDSIRIHDKFLLILSEHSVQSDWVEHEVEHALDIEKEKKKNVLFPVRMDEAVMESKTGWAGNVRWQRHIGDFTRWKDHGAYLKAFERLLRDLKADE